MHESATQSLAIAIGVSALVTVACERLRFPAILPLLMVGLALGASGAGVVDADAMGRSLGALITVSIGLLIFEGTLHLNKEELRRAPGAVRGLLTAGAVMTWAGSAGLAWGVLGLRVPSALLLGATLIVTGPTVVQPILRRVRVTPRLHTVLSAEAVFIDPIGVVATVTTLEVIRSYAVAGASSDLWLNAAWLYARPIVGGCLVGLLIGLGAQVVLRRAARDRRIEPKRLNLFSVGICMLSVGAGEALSPEAGLWAVTMSGLILARVRIIGATELRAFKEQLATILVGTLFVLLASRFNADRLGSVGWREAAFVAGLMFVIRPASVFVATIRSSLSAGERVFAACFAPRGIVALSVASIAGNELTRLADVDGRPALPWVARLADDGARLELAMFLVIAATVFVGGVLSPLLARAAGVRAGQAGGVILVGGHALSLALADFLRERNIRVRVVDTNDTRVSEALAMGIEAFRGDATDGRWLDDVVFTPEYGWVVAWTGNDTVDRLAARWAQERLGPGHAGIWSAGAVKPDAAGLELGGGRLLGDTIDAVEAGKVEIGPLEAAESSDRIFACLEEGKFRLLFAGASPPGPGATLVGVRPRREPDVVELMRHSTGRRA